MRVVLYLRVSTTDQSLDLQRNELTDFAKARGWQIVKTYEDFGVSGTTANRPQLKELMRDARARRFDVLCVFKLDRFARSLKDLVSMLQELSDLGVQFVSLRDQIDMTTAAGRFMLHLLGAFGELEAALIRERVMAGLENAKRKGKTLGRPKLRNDAAIRALRARGMTYREIGNELNAGRGAIYRALKSFTKSP
jgi:DNA invertase Pin-like site-specific DNA recombinase